MWAFRQGPVIPNVKGPSAPACQLEERYKTRATPSSDSYAHIKEHKTPYFTLW